MFSQFLLPALFAHAFGQRYELPIPLALFLLGGAGVVLLSFFLTLRRNVSQRPEQKSSSSRNIGLVKWPWLVLSILSLTGFIVIGLLGSQVVAENILPTVFWLFVWIAVPLSCAIFGNWTQRFNAFAAISQVFGSPKIRKVIIGQPQPLRWPSWLGYWPAVISFFIIACGELIYNATATLPAVTAIGLLIYSLICAAGGLLYGKAWLEYGELFSVLFVVWGRMGYWRIGAPGHRGFAGGLDKPFSSSPSRIAFVLLLLVSVSFDGLLATPSWSNVSHQLTGIFANGSAAYHLLLVGVFALLSLIIYGLFYGFSLLVCRFGGRGRAAIVELAALLPSLVPISFGYLLAHNIQYLMVNSQLILPLIGNPIGREWWPLHLVFPFNDTFELNPHVLPTAAYWYFAVVVIIIVHIVAIILAHRHLATATKVRGDAVRSEYPWVGAMVAYTMLSLWLLAQPLVKEQPKAQSYQNGSQRTLSLLTVTDVNAR